MAKNFLNLDQFADPKRTVSLHGKEYSVRGMTVARFIDAIRAEQDLEAKKDDTAAQFEAAIRAIRIAIPDIPEDVLRELNFPQLNILVEFIRGELDDKVAEVQPTEVAGGTEPGEVQK